jgi:hypothetical protein
MAPPGLIPNTMTGGAAVMGPLPLPGRLLLLLLLWVGRS